MANVVSNFKAVVGSRGCRYAHYVEYGTRKMSAQPYLRPALAFAGPFGMSELSRECITEIQNRLGSG